MNLYKKRWLILLPAAAFTLLLVVAMLRPGPEMDASLNLSPLVNTMKVSDDRLVPFVTGYGRARPKKIWQAVAEVSGSVIYRHPDLQKGKPIAGQTVILKIDPTDYELKLAQANSDLSSANAELTRTKLNEEKLALSLQLEQQQLAILEKELVRKQGLLKNGSVSRSSVEMEQRNVLVQQQKVLDLENAISQFPSDLAVAQAKVQLAESKLAEARRKLDKTVMVMPFDGRIASVDVERDEVVAEGQSLLVAHKADVMEVSVQVPMSEMRNFRQYAGISPVSKDKQMNVADAKLKASVTLYVGNDQFSWEGVLSSIGESIDSQGNTVLMIVDVDMRNQPSPPGKQPPLINDMYVESRIFGQPTMLPLIPVDAVHGERVYTLSDESRLQIKPVRIAFEHDGMVAITEGLDAGDVLILSDVIPPIQGIALRTLETLQ